MSDYPIAPGDWVQVEGGHEGIPHRHDKTWWCVHHLYGDVAVDVTSEWSNALSPWRSSGRGRELRVPIQHVLRVERDKTIVACRWAGKLWEIDELNAHMGELHEDERGA